MHTREIAFYGGLVKRMPVFAAVFLLFTMGNVGLPGTSGFVGEIMTLTGVYFSSTWTAVAATTGVILSAVYALSLYRRVVLGEMTNPALAEITDMNLREMLIFAPLFENLFMIGAAAIHEKLLGRRFLFVATPLLMTALHFTTPHELPFPTTIRAIEIFGFFYVYLKQYDLHKLEIGKPKALFLSSLLHFACNATVLLTLLIFDFVIDAETTFSAQPGE
jgi:NADH:ubiquinone oxidoreductase subunit 5 (subunit L)/multisubunit Na+/H+ antiporter MnhA subunit